MYYLNVVEIGHFEKIRRLHLRGNHLGNLERLTFTAFGFSTLEYLDLSQTSYDRVNFIMRKNNLLD
jgi:hypothetical protein